MRRSSHRRVEVVQEIGGRIAVFGDEDVHAAVRRMVAAAYNEKAPPTNSLRWTVTLSVSYSRHNRPEVLRPLDECQHLLARSHKKVRPLVLNAPNRSPGSAYSSCLPRLSKKRVSTMPTLWSATMCATSCSATSSAGAATIRPGEGTPKHRD